MSNKFNVSIDATSVEKEAMKTMELKMRQCTDVQISSFFSITKEYAGGKIFSIKGEGFKEIESIIADRFLSDEFKEKANKFFDHHWERIFEECMTKAIQHKANAIVFAKTKDKQ